MYNACYLLDTKRLQRTKTWEALLDQERLQKYARINAEKAAVQSLGAGLLLQLAAGEYLLGEEHLATAPIICLDADLLAMRLRTCLEALRERKSEFLACREAERNGATGSEESGDGETGKEDRRGDASDAKSWYLDLSYEVNGFGKPFFKDLPLFFSISHSGDQILCACSEQEIGADLQKVTSQNWYGIAERFFSKEEKEYLETMPERTSARDAFFKLWTKKEAYGKLMGEGLLAVIHLPFSEKRDGLSWREGQFTTEDGVKYYYSVCQKLCEE